MRSVTNGASVVECEEEVMKYTTLKSLLRKLNFGVKDNVILNIATFFENKDILQKKKPKIGLLRAKDLLHRKAIVRRSDSKFDLRRTLMRC